jgi:hypothetical protein
MRKVAQSIKVLKAMSLQRLEALKQSWQIVQNYALQAEGHWFESSNSHINSQRVISLNTCNPFSFLNGLCFTQY